MSVLCWVNTINFIIIILEKSEWGEKRYFKIATSIYKDLDDRLSNSEYLAGDYSIADIATFFLGLQDTNGMISDLNNLRILPDGIQ